MIYATSHNVIIIGAGIAGLTAALFMKKAGLTPQLYDEGEGITETDAPLMIAPNGISVLNELSLAERIYANGVAVDKTTIRNRRGRLLDSYKSTGEGTKLYDFSAVCLPRKKVHEILVEAVLESGIPIHYKKQLKNVTGSYSQRGVSAYFDDGTSARGDILIGADGIQSTTRTIAFPDNPGPRYTGLVGICGYTDASFIPQLPEERASHATSIGAGKNFSYSPVELSGKIGWWANLTVENETHVNTLRDLPLSKIKEQLLTNYQGWHYPVESVISSSYSAEVHKVLELTDMTKWYGGRVVLIGNAAHAMIPVAGQGVATALEDGMYLAKLLRDNKTSSLARVFEEYQYHRRARVNQIIRLAHRYGKPERISSRIELAVRDFVTSSFTSLFGVHKSSAIYSYRIDWNS